MKLHDYFSGLLAHEININRSRLVDLERHVGALSNCLKKDAALRSVLIGFSCQGSWAHGTIIRPQPGCEYDADVLVRMRHRRGWARDPQQYLHAVHASLARSERYRGRIELKTRCVRVSYAGDCHVDLVPCLEYGFSYFDEHFIVNRTENMLESVNPAGFATWFQGKDRMAGGNLRRTVRLLKFVRDFHGRFDIPSVVLTVLVAGRVSRWDEFWLRYRDLPSAFTRLVDRTNELVQRYPAPPSLSDPSCPGADFSGRLGGLEWSRFRSSFDLYAGTVNAAFDATRRTRSIELWREVFNDEFAPR